MSTGFSSNHTTKLQEMKCEKIGRLSLQWGGGRGVDGGVDGVDDAYE